MAKWHGVLGFTEPEKETAPGVFMPSGVIERQYFGDVLQNRISNQGAEKLVDDISVSNTISVLADPYAMNHIGFLCYISYLGSRWEISSVEPAYPRLKLTLGGLYHGEIPD